MQGQSEFQFSESSGEIGPYEVKHIEVFFKPHYPRSLKTVIECKVENGTGRLGGATFFSFFFRFFAEVDIFLG